MGKLAKTTSVPFICVADNDFISHHYGNHYGKPHQHICIYSLDSHINIKTKAYKNQGSIDRHPHYANHRHIANRDADFHLHRYTDDYVYANRYSDSHHDPNRYNSAGNRDNA